jgi:hypothetical protein
LTHKAVIGIDKTLLAASIDLSGVGGFLTYGGTSLLAAWLLHVGVERPLLLLRDGKRAAGPLNFACGRRRRWSA